VLRHHQERNEEVVVLCLQSGRGSFSLGPVTQRGKEVYDEEKREKEGQAFRLLADFVTIFRNTALC